MADTQEDQLSFFSQDFKDLFGRRLKLIDCEKTFSARQTSTRASRTQTPEASAIDHE